MNKISQGMVQLIINEYDKDDFGKLKPDHSTGFGFCIDKGYGRTLRIGVKIKNSAAIEDFKKLWKILSMALIDSNNPKFKPAIGYECLHNNEIILEEFEFEEMVKNE